VPTAPRIPCTVLYCYCIIFCFAVLSGGACGAGKGAEGTSSKAVKRALRLCLLRLEPMASQDSGSGAKERTLQLASLLLPFLLPRPKVSTKTPLRPSTPVSPSAEPPGLSKRPGC